MKESEWTRKVCKEMEHYGATVIALVGGDTRQRRGLPDRLVCRERTWLVEFKGEKTKVAPLQVAVHRECNRYGRNAFIARYPGVLSCGEKFVGNFETGPQLLQLLVTFTESSQLTS